MKIILLKTNEMRVPKQFCKGFYICKLCYKIGGCTVHMIFNVFEILNWLITCYLLFIFSLPQGLGKACDITTKN